MILSQEKFAVACGGNPLLAEKWFACTAAAMDEFQISASPEREAMFLAQVAHESAGFALVEENLNYSAEALQRLFWRHISADEVHAYARNPQAIANRVYANRMGNGDEASGDGWKYRGRGLIQLTGRANYAAFDIWDGKRYQPGGLVDAPDLALLPHMAARIAGWYWHGHACNELADAGNFEAITRAINGGVIGLQDRQARLAAIQKEMSA